MKSSIESIGIMGEKGWHLGRWHYSRHTTARLWSLHKLYFLFLVAHFAGIRCMLRFKNKILESDWLVMTTLWTVTSIKFHSQHTYALLHPPSTLQIFFDKFSTLSLSLFLVLFSINLSLFLNFYLSTEYFLNLSLSLFLLYTFSTFSISLSVSFV